MGQPPKSGCLAWKNGSSGEGALPYQLGHRVRMRIIAQASIAHRRRPARPARSLTFGVRIHDCVGANLARAEMREALAFLGSRVRSIRARGASARPRHPAWTPGVTTYSPPTLRSRTGERTGSSVDPCGGERPGPTRDEPPPPRGLRSRIRLHDGRTFCGELPAERHRALQVGLLYARSAGAGRAGRRHATRRDASDPHSHACRPLPARRQHRARWLARGSARACVQARGASPGHLSFATSKRSPA